MVFPALFGPSTEVILPWITAKLTPSTAAGPPQCLRMPCTRSMVDICPPGRGFVRCSWTIARAKSIYALYGKHSNQLSLHVKHYSHPPNPLLYKLLTPYCPDHLPGEQDSIYTGQLPAILQHLLYTQSMRHVLH